MIVSALAALTCGLVRLFRGRFEAPSQGAAANVPEEP